MGVLDTMTQSPEEFPQDIAGQMRRRGLLGALYSVDAPQKAVNADRIQDDPVSRSNPQAYGEPQAQAPVGQSPTQRDTLADQMMAEYQRLGQPEALPPQPSLKQQILGGLLRAAPVALGAAFGGSAGATGAAQGEEGSLQRQQRMTLAQQQMAQQHEQQRNSLRERMLQEIMMRQHQQEQEQQFQQRETDMGNRLSQQIQARSDLDAQTAKARDAETERKEQFQAAENEKKRQFEAGENEKKEKLRREEDDQKFELMMKRMGQTEQGSWSMQEDPQTGKPVLFNAKTGQTRAAPPGVGPKGSYQKNLGGALDAQNYAQDYLSRGVFTGPGDEALQEKFFELAKPSTGFRMTQPQIDMLQHSRSWMNGLEARVRHATTGTWFTDTQRRQIVATMNELAEAKKATAGGQGARPGNAGGLQITRDANGRIIGVQ